MLVRDYTNSDKPACLAIFSSNIPVYFAEHELQEFDEFLDGTGSMYLVAEDADGRVVGCGGYYVRDGVGRLCWGMVDRSRHRGGFGSVLLSARLDRLFHEQGVEWVSITTSQHSCGFFERVGFQTESVEENGLADGLHAHVMNLAKGDYLSRSP